MTDMALDHSCQVQRHPLADRGDDLYGTPPVATEALLAVEPTLPRRIWEPAVGRGNIARVLLDAGHEVIGTDPPFKVADQFVAHALDLCPRVVLLLRLAFYESERRTPILEGRGLARVRVFRGRLPMMHRDGWEGRKANSGMAFAWFVWDRAHIGPPVLNRMDWTTSQGPLRRRAPASLRKAPSAPREESLTCAVKGADRSTSLTGGEPLPRGDLS